MSEQIQRLSHHIRVHLIGCDDETVFEIDCTPLEVSFLTKLQKLSKETSTYRCMPRLAIEEIL
jgi:hypothetical protein